MFKFTSHVHQEKVPHMTIDFEQQIVDEFRANRGVGGGPSQDSRLLLLTTTGARSGASHTVPLGFMPDEHGRTIVIGSANGAPAHPGWFHNLQANPRATVETGTFTFEADAQVLEGGERDRVFARAVEADPGWADYQAKTDRVIPVVALVAASGGPNANKLGDSLVEIHDMFRGELAMIRSEVARSGPRVGAQLRINYLTLCQGLHFHHTGEDTQMFPSLVEQHPELVDTIERLRTEHERVEVLLDELQERISIDADPTTVVGDVDRLTDELLAHLDYEEEQLVPVLNTATA